MVEKRGEPDIVSFRNSPLSNRLLGDMIHRKILYLLSKNRINDFDLYNLIRDFFKEFLVVDYEFTFEELIAELDRVFIERLLKENIVSFLQRVRVIEYKDNPLDEDHLRESLREFDRLSAALIKQGQRVKPTGFFSRVFGRKKTEPEEPAVVRKTPVVTLDSRNQPRQEESPAKEENVIGAETASEVMELLPPDDFDSKGGKDAKQKSSFEVPDIENEDFLEIAKRLDTKFMPMQKGKAARGDEKLGGLDGSDEEEPKKLENVTQADSSMEITAESPGEGLKEDSDETIDSLQKEVSQLKAGKAPSRASAKAPARAPAMPTSVSAWLQDSSQGKAGGADEPQHAKEFTTEVSPKHALQKANAIAAKATGRKTNVPGKKSKAEKVRREKGQRELRKRQELERRKAAKQEMEEREKARKIKQKKAKEAKAAKMLAKKDRMNAMKAKKAKKKMKPKPAKRKAVKKPAGKSPKKPAAKKTSSNPKPRKPKGRVQPPSGKSIVLAMIAEARKLKDIQQRKDAYKNVLTEYAILEQQEKPKVYPALKLLFESISK